MLGPVGRRTTNGDGSATWKQRNGRGRYYTRSHREGGRIVREYVGSDEVAELTADVDDLARQSRLAARAALAQERDRIAALEATVLRFSRAVDPAVTCELLAAGYHRHDRRPWRRRRGGR